jgi:two-component system cell cycle response regulator
VGIIPHGTEKPMGAKVLIIEDNVSNLELMTYLLTAFGHWVSKAETGRAGLEAAQSDSFDVVLCDIHLPDINGDEIARQLKASARWRSAPLIAVTALAMLGDRERLLAAGFDGYISKPIDPEGFVPQVEKFAKRLPSLPKQAVMTPDQEPPPADVSQGTVMVLDDSQQARYFLRFVLEPSGYRVEEATTIAEAISLGRKVAPRLMISDMNLTNEDGEQFLAQVKQDQQLRDIPVILITSSDKPSQQKIERVKEAGAKAFLIRPFAPEDVLRAVESALSENG